MTVLLRLFSFHACWKSLRSIAFCKYLILSYFSFITLNSPVSLQIEQPFSRVFSCSVANFFNEWSKYWPSYCTYQRPYSPLRSIRVLWNTRFCFRKYIFKYFTLFSILFTIGSITPISCKIASRKTCKSHEFPPLLLVFSSFILMSGKRCLASWTRSGTSVTLNSLATVQLFPVIRTCLWRGCRTWIHCYNQRFLSQDWEMTNFLQFFLKPRIPFIFIQLHIDPTKFTTFII